MLQKGGEASGSSDFGVPEDLCYIYAMEQVNSREDLMTPKQTWKKIKAFLILLHPGNTKMVKKKLKEIKEFKESN